MQRLPAKELERVVVKTLNEWLADTWWLAEQIKGHARKATAVDILCATEQRVVEEHIPNDDAQSLIFLSITDRFDAHKDRLVVSLNLATLAKPEAAHTPIPAIFEFPSKGVRTAAPSRSSLQSKVPHKKIRTL